MGLKVTNNAFGTLNAGITSSATTIVLASGQGARFPSLGAGDYFYATLIDTSNNLEIVKVTARSTDTMTVVRGQDGTTARAYSTNDRFELRPTAALFNEKANTADVAATYVELAGDTMTGELIIEKSQAARTSIKVRNGNTDGTADAAWDLFTANGNWVGVARRNGGYDILRPDGNIAHRIDNSGRVTLPYQPAFRVYDASASSNSDVSFATVDTTFNGRNAGWNTSTNTFTAPVAGVYLFTFGFLHGQGGSESYVRAIFKINGTASTQYGETLQDMTAQYTPTNLAMAFRLAVGDTVKVFNEGRKIYGTQYTSFSGFLIG